MLSLEPVEGALRVRLGEPDWRALFGRAGIDSDSSALRPLALADHVEELASADVDEALVEAARLALAGADSGALVALEVTTASRSRGVFAALASDGASAASAVRAVVVPDDPEGQTRLAPGVEASAFPTDGLVGEVMRLFPPEVPDPTPVPVDARSFERQPVAQLVAQLVALPQTDALVLARALQAGDDTLAGEVAAQCGWSRVPDLLVALAEEVRGNVTVTLRVAGTDTIGVRRWLQCGLGWVAVSVEGERVTHELRTREQIAEDLVFWLTGAFDAALAAPSGVSGSG